MEEEQSVAGASNSSIAPIGLTIETEKIQITISKYWEKIQITISIYWEKRLKAMTASCQNLPFLIKTINQIW